jgi:heterodisulfide reductase subunit A-like polyferredoxin
MPARGEEVHEAVDEGLRLMPLVSVKRMLGSNGQVQGVEAQRTRLGRKGKDGRRVPVLISGSEFTLPATSVILAVGQEAETELLAQRLGLRLREDGRIWTDAETCETSRTGLFACGDLAGREESVVGAMASGRRAARGIHLYLSGEALDMDPFVVPRDSTPVEKVPVEDVPLGCRQRIPLAEREARSRSFEVAALAFRERIAVAEARRCLNCGLCTLCGDCIRSCPYLAIEKRDGVITITPECEGCGLCEQVCPTGAISMVPVPEDFWQQRAEWRSARGE